jgi:formate dehydrogenase major subunit
MLEVTINGSSQTLPEGLTILAALRRLGIVVPSLCHDQRLRPTEACRLCLVQVAGRERPVPSCQQTLEAGMRIETHTPELEAYRRGILQMLSQHCAVPSAQALPEKECHATLAYYGVAATESAAPGVAAVPDESHPYIRVDMSQCIA